MADLSFYDLTYNGPVVQALLDTANKLKSDGYICLGAGSPGTVPGTTTERVWYLCGPGTYTNFGSSVTVPDGSLMVATFDGSAWSKTLIEVANGGSLSAALTSTSYSNRIIKSTGVDEPSSVNGLRMVAYYDISGYVGWTINFQCYNNYANAYSWAVFREGTTIGQYGSTYNTDMRTISELTSAAGVVNGSITVESGDKYLAVVWYDAAGKRTNSATATRLVTEQVMKNTEDIATLQYNYSHLYQNHFVVGKSNWSSISKTASHYIKASDGTNGGSNNWGGTGNYYVTGYIDVSNYATLEYYLPFPSNVSAAMIAAYKEDYTYDATNSVTRSEKGTSQGVWTRASTTKYVRFTIYYGKGSSIFYAFDPTDPSNLLYWLRNDINEITDYAGNNIVTLNRDRDGIIANLGGAATTLRLLHFSDLHQDPANMQRIMDWANEHYDEMDDILNTGDTVNNTYSGTITGYGDVEGVGSILYVIGNHDIYDGSSYSHSGVDGYNTYIKPNVANWGVTQPTNAESGGKCYYYKDYAAKGIRLVVLDAIVAYTSSSDQRTWFQGVLSDAKTNSLAVVVATHWLDTVYKPIKQHFTPWEDFDQDVSAGSALILEDVQTFIDGGGEFVCHLVGHSHKDIIGTAENYPKQLCVMVGSANGLPSSNTLSVTHGGGEVRVTGTRSQDSFNLVGINTTAKCVTVVKIGVDCNVYAQHKDYVRINYQTMEEVFTVNGELSGKEDKVSVAAISGTTLAAAVGTYYVGASVGTLAVTLPTVSDATHVAAVVLNIATGSSPNITFAAATGVTISYSKGFALDASKEYEVNCLWQGTKWIIMEQEVETPS